MQRSFDQIFQELVLQGLPAVLCMDRAGLVGGDGAVHHGLLDIAFLRSFPDITLLAPADENELKASLRFALAQPRACAIRYPRANVPDSLGDAPPFIAGVSRLMREGREATILAYGASVVAALGAADLLASQQVFVRVVNARFAKPIDEDMVRTALSARHPVFTVEDHCVVGGFGTSVLETAQELGLPTQLLHRLGIPADRFISHGSRAGQLAECGIDEASIAATVAEAVGIPRRRTVPQTWAVPAAARPSADSVAVPPRPR